MTQIKLSKCEDLPHGGFIYYDKVRKMAFIVREGALFYVSEMATKEDVEKAIPRYPETGTLKIIEGILEPSFVLVDQVTKKA